MSPLHALVRYWWIVLAGVVAAAVVALVVLGQQPKAVYTAAENVLVTSPSAPYLRTAQNGPSGPASKQKKPIAASSSPTDTQSLVNAANLYPLLIQSDQIARLRESLYGPAPGTLSADALASSTNTYGVYHPSPLPVITVKAGAPTPAAAKKLAVDTVKAFGVWILREQRSSAIPAAQRISVERLGVRVRSHGGPSAGLPLFSALLVLVGFCGLAVLADRVQRRGDAAAQESAPARPHRHVA